MERMYLSVEASFAFYMEKEKGAYREAAGSIWFGLFSGFTLVCDF